MVLCFSNIFVESSESILLHTSSAIIEYFLPNYLKFSPLDRPYDDQNSIQFSFTAKQLSH